MINARNSYPIVTRKHYEPTSSIARAWEWSPVRTKKPCRRVNNHWYDLVGLAHLEGCGIEKNGRSAYYWLRMAEENSRELRQRTEP